MLKSGKAGSRGWAPCKSELAMAQAQRKSAQNGWDLIFEFNFSQKALTF